VEKLRQLGPEIFLDLKFHDIPNTVTGAVSSAMSLPGVRLLDVHTLGGLEMMRAAAKARDECNLPKTVRPKLIGVTILTSMDNEALRNVGIAGPASKRVVSLARLAKKAGRIPRGMTVGAAQHPERIVQRRDIEHSMQAGSGQHLIHQSGRVDQLELDAMIASPVMQGHQGIQSPAIHEFQLREIQHYDARLFFRNHGIPQRGHLHAAHQSSRTVDHGHVIGFFNIDRQHD